MVEEDNQLQSATLVNEAKNTRKGEDSEVVLKRSEPCFALPRHRTKCAVIATGGNHGPSKLCHRGSSVLSSDWSPSDHKQVLFSESSHMHSLFES